jgi:hypothetical protein
VQTISSRIVVEGFAKAIWIHDGPDCADTFGFPLRQVIEFAQNRIALHKEPFFLTSRLIRSLSNA